MEDVSTYHLGGYVLFGRDFKDKTAEEVTSAIASYQAAAESDTSIPLLIGVDEEGGTVVRVSSNPNLSPEGSSPPPSASMPRGAWTPSAPTRRGRAICSSPTASM